MVRTPVGVNVRVAAMPSTDRTQQPLSKGDAIFFVLSLLGAGAVPFGFFYGLFGDEIFSPSSWIAWVYVVGIGLATVGWIGLRRFLRRQVTGQPKS